MSRLAVTARLTLSLAARAQTAEMDEASPPQTLTTLPPPHCQLPAPSTPSPLVTSNPACVEGIQRHPQGGTPVAPGILFTSHPPTKKEERPPWVLPQQKMPSKPPLPCSCQKTEVKQPPLTLLRSTKTDKRALFVCSFAEGEGQRLPLAFSFAKRSRERRSFYASGVTEGRPSMPVVYFLTRRRATATVAVYSLSFASLVKLLRAALDLIQSRSAVSSVGVSFGNCWIEPSLDKSKIFDSSNVRLAQSK
jgi:hypothetical protein